jgi:hypothetical protein
MTSPADRDPLAGGTPAEGGARREGGVGGGLADRGVEEPGGWASFAAVVLFMVGMLNFFWGLAGVLNSDVLTVGGTEVMLWSLTAWGWIHLLVGVLMVLTAVGLFAMQEWARWTAVFFAALNAIVQIAVITAFPIWSLLIIALNVIVIYQLTERWTAASRAGSGAVR